MEDLEWAGTSSLAVGARREQSQAAGTHSFPTNSDLQALTNELSDLQTLTNEFSDLQVQNERPPNNSRLRMVL